MSKNDTEFDDDFALFSDAVKGVKKLQQDTIIQPPKRNAKQKEITRTARQASDSEFYFSDEFIPHLSEEGPTRYARDDVSKYEVKRLRRGVYVPDVYLDMHGMTQQEAKRELGAMIAHCIKESVACACVQHGIGKHILETESAFVVSTAPRCDGFSPSTFRVRRPWGATGFTCYPR